MPVAMAILSIGSVGFFCRILGSHLTQLNTTMEPVIRILLLLDHKENVERGRSPR